ncbi:retropepsin-like aspartic protease [Flammeovirga sp. EKP202]|uniref:retropepsin-like aspartic protease n=1 Tax=Flammeovirga sp. EKP202 TaxID=2770592 RepID=UPI00165F19C0|nr:retropepsin-like aspartic protease [Flammeovirga sp. EKP202]MBD0402893.1 retropepsin-like domain-containing protein [Flammeovirga sp. EKP202]
MKKYISLLFILLSLSSCHFNKLYHLMKKGELISEDNQITIPFETRMGLIIIKVMINGKKYDFLVDTGAMNVISIEMAEEYQFKKKHKISASDSQNNKQNAFFYEIPELFIENFSFKNTNCIALDIYDEKLNFSCLGVDGIIGSNLMKEGIWQIDYQKEEITIYKNNTPLDLSAYDSIRFSSDDQFNPIVPINIHGATSTLKVDTGSNGYLRLNGKYMESVLKKDSLEFITSQYGSITSGIFGKGKNQTKKFYKADSLLLGDYLCQDFIIGFQEKGSHLLGNRFFANYNLVINWQKKMLYIKPVDEIILHSDKRFPLSIDRKEDLKTYYIRSIFNNYQDQHGNITVGDTVISINQIPTTNFTSDSYCEFLQIQENSNRLDFEFIHNNDTLSHTIFSEEQYQ